MPKLVIAPHPPLLGWCRGLGLEYCFIRGRFTDELRDDSLSPEVLGGRPSGAQPGLPVPRWLTLVNAYLNYIIEARKEVPVTFVMLNVKQQLRFDPLKIYLDKDLTYIAIAPAAISCTRDVGLCLCLSR